MKKIEMKEIMLIGEKINPYKIIEENIFEKEIGKLLKERNILYFKSELIKKVNYFYLIQQSFELLNYNINKIKFNFLCQIDHRMEDINEFKKAQNLFIILSTFDGNKICLFSENSSNQKGNEFCLLLDFNEILYYCKKGEEKTKKNNKNEIFRKVCGIEKEKHWKKTKLGFIDCILWEFENEFLQERKIDNVEDKIEFMEIYHILFY